MPSLPTARSQKVYSGIQRLLKKKKTKSPDQYINAKKSQTFKHSLGGRKFVIVLLEVVACAWFLYARKMNAFFKRTSVTEVEF